MPRQGIAVAAMFILWSRAALAEPLCPTPHAQVDAPTIPEEAEARADTFFEKAWRFFEHEDFAAAAVVFGHAEGLYAQLAAGPDGRAAGARFRRCAYAALSNSATAYSAANMPVEAVEAFRRLEATYGEDMPPDERPRVAAAIDGLSRQIGLLALAGVPEDAELRLDGRALSRDLAAQPVRLAAGVHAVEVTARFHQPYLHQFTIVGGETTTVAVQLAPLDTPAAVRVEASVAGAEVTLDGRRVGTAPVEVSLPPGAHEWSVAARTYRPERGRVEVRPGERTVVRVGLVPSRAPLGFRVDPFAAWLFYLRRDTPFEAMSLGAGLRVFHDYLRFGELWIGFGLEWHARQLDQVAAGPVLRWCPDRLTFAGGALAWCPALVAGMGTLGPRSYDDDFRSGLFTIKALTALEYRRGRFAFVRASAGGEVVTYASAADREYMLLLPAVTLEVAAGLEL